MIWWPFQEKKVGLALGGGVARGIAHIGVLKVLKQAGVKIDYIAGTSSGSLIGAAYASGMELRLIEQIALRIKWGDFFKFSLFRPGFISAEAIADFVDRFIGHLQFSELKIPFAAVATDFKNGERIVLNHGSVSRAVAASSAFPGVFSPVEIDQRQLIDGGLSSNVPVRVARELGATYVIASDVIPLQPASLVPRDAFQVLGRSLDMIFRQLSRQEEGEADVRIDLLMDDEDIWHMDLHKAKKLISSGEAAAHRVLHRIRKDLGLKSS